MPLFSFLIPVGKPALHQVHGFGFPVFLPERLHGLDIHVHGFCKIRHRKLLLSVPRRHPASHILFLGIQIKDKLRLGRQIGCNLLRIFLHDIHNALQLRQHGIIELRQIIPSHLEIQGSVGAEPGDGPDFLLEFLLQPAESILVHIISSPHAIVKMRHAAVHRHSVEPPALPQGILAYGHGYLRILFLCMKCPPGFGAAVPVFIIKAVRPGQSVELVQSPAKKPKFRVLGGRLFCIIARLDHSLLKGLLLLHDTSDKINPFPGVLHEIADVMVETGTASVGCRPGLLHILEEFEQILYDKHFLFAHLKGNGQIPVLQCHPGRQHQALRLSYGIRYHTVGPLFGKCLDQHHSPLVRGISQIFFLQLLLHQHHKRRQIGTVLFPVISGIIVPAAFRALTFRKQDRLPVKNDMYRKGYPSLAA